MSDGVFFKANPFLKSLKTLKVGQKEYKYYDLQSLDEKKYRKYFQQSASTVAPS